jgi:uridine phosphorylase
MGAANSAKHFAAAIAASRPRLVLTCGFAGGLNPNLARGDVVFSADDGFPLCAALKTIGARPVTFHCDVKVATTAADKAGLRQKTGADVVEMESGVIRRICQAQGIPSATVRVISDAAEDNLPLDFNELMTPDQQMDWPRLVWAILKNPAKIGELMRFQKQTISAAENLASTLASVISPASPPH